MMLSSSMAMVNPIATAVFRLSLLLCVTAPAAFAQSVSLGSEQVVASRGGVSLTLGEIDARIMELPVHLRAGYLDDPVRIEETISGMLLEKQLAAKAYELGAGNDPHLAIQLEQAKTRYLAARARKLHDEQMQIPDFADLAEETYLAHPDRYTTKDTYDLTHVLIMEQGRTAEEARARAEEVRRLAASGTGERTFDDLVAEYTDEKSQGRPSTGKLRGATAGLFEPSFEEAAFKLRKPGEISEVVKTSYGYHVIRLDSYTPGKLEPFEKVQAKIVKELRDAFIKKNKANFGDTLRSMKIDASPELVASLRTRYGPEGPKADTTPRSADAGASASATHP